MATRKQRQVGTPKNVKGTTRTTKTGNGKKNVLAMSRYRRKVV